MLTNNKAILAELFRDNPAGTAIYLTEKMKQNDFNAARAALSHVMQAQNVQMLARERAHRGDAIVAEQELVVDDQLPVRVEDAHVVVDETCGEYFWKNTERVVDA